MSDDHDEINTTRGEKALAFVLAVFLLVGGLWVYFEPLSRDAHEVQPTSQQRAAIDARDRAQDDVSRLEDRVDHRQDDYVQAREDYRTDLDAHSSTAVTKPQFQRALARFNEAKRDLAAA